MALGLVVVDYSANRCGDHQVLFESWLPDAGSVLFLSASGNTYQAALGVALSKPLSLFGAYPTDLGDVDHLFIRSDAFHFIIGLPL
jgi:hypothetical protein